MSRLALAAHRSPPPENGGSFLFLIVTTYMNQHKQKCDFRYLAANFSMISGIGLFTILSTLAFAGDGVRTVYPDGSDVIESSDGGVPDEEPPVLSQEAQRLLLKEAYGKVPREKLSFDLDDDGIMEDLQVRLEKHKKNPFEKQDDRYGVWIRTVARWKAVGIENLENDYGKFLNTQVYDGMLDDWIFAELTEDQIRRIAKDRRVLYLMDNHMLEAQMAYSGTHRWTGRMWLWDNHPDISGDVSGDINTYTDQDISIAILDSGINSNHEMLNGTGKIAGQKDFVNNDAIADDEGGNFCNWHGTHVAGIAAGESIQVNQLLSNGKYLSGQYMGVAPGARIVAAKVLANLTSGCGTYANVFTKSAEWIIQNASLWNIKVANLSATTTSGICSVDFTPEDAALRNMWNAGITVVTSAGNDGDNPCSIGHTIKDWQDANNNLNDVIVVGNMLSPDKYQPTSGHPGSYQAGWSVNQSSARGENSQYVNWTNRQPSKPDIMAPGSEIYSADGGAGGTSLIGKTGTSMASPYIAGTAALIYDMNSTFTNTQVRDQLLGQALNLNYDGNDEKIDTGHGLVDVAKAVSSTYPFAERGHVFTFITKTLAPQTAYNYEFTNPVFPISVTSIAENHHPTVGASRNHRLRIDYQKQEVSGCGASGNWYSSMDSGAGEYRQHNVYSLDQTKACKWRVRIRNEMSQSQPVIDFRVIISR